MPVTRNLSQQQDLWIAKNTALLNQLIGGKHMRLVFAEREGTAMKLEIVLRW